MSRLLSAFILLLAFQSFDSGASDDASVQCPSKAELNETTRFYLEKAVTRLLSEQQYKRELNSVGFVTPIETENIRLLTTENDSAVCQKLNEIYGDFRNTEIFDRESGQYVPSMFGVYYEIQDKYVVSWQPYNPGSDVAGQIGAPGTGWRFAIVYDKDNLTYRGRIGF